MRWTYLDEARLHVFECEFVEVDVEDFAVLGGGAIEVCDEVFV